MKQPKQDTTVKQVAATAVQARARVNRFLLSEVGSQFCAGEPELDVIEERWRVPILLVTPGLVVGQVGEAVVQLHTREIISHTDIKQIHVAADRLRKRRHVEIYFAGLTSTHMRAEDFGAYSIQEVSR